MIASANFLAQFRSNYGSSFSQTKPDFSKCAALVDVTPKERWSSLSQCSRKNGHGPHGAWCKQHDPDARKAKDEARHKKYREKWVDMARKSAFEAGCQTAIREIAAGHNDPRGLAQSLIDALEGKS